MLGLTGPAYRTVKSVGAIDAAATPRPILSIAADARRSMFAD
jgi:hypothetical protein